MSWKEICCVNQITTRSDDLADNDDSGQSLKLNCAVHDPDCGTLSRGSRHANRHRSGPDKGEGYAIRWREPQSGVSSAGPPIVASKMPQTPPQKMVTCNSKNTDL